MVKLLLLGSIPLLLTGKALAQTPPSVGNKDSNPYNPANWQDMPKIGTDIENGKSYSLDSTGAVVDTSFINVYLPVPDPISAYSVATNTSSHDYWAEVTRSASVTLTKKWIGIGPAPQQVWVLKKASVALRLTPDGTATLDNGLGSPTVQTFDAGVTNYTASGEKLSQVSLSGDLLQVSFSESAHGIAHGNPSAYSNSAQSFANYAIELKAVQLGTNFGGTFVRVPGTWNRMSAPLGETHVTGTMLYDGATPFGWGLDVTWLSSLIGDWTDPYHVWTDGITNWNDDFLHEYDSVNAKYVYLSAVVDGIPAGGPKSQTMNLTVDDEGNNRDHTAIPTSHLLKIYAHTMYPKFIEEGDITYDAVEEFEIDAPGHSLSGAGITCHWQSKKDIWDVFGHVLDAGFILSVISGDEVVAGIIHALSLVVEDFEPVADSNVAPWAWGPSWVDSTYDGKLWDSVNPPDPGNPLYENWQMVPGLKAKYQNKLIEAEGWGTDGFQGRLAEWGKFRIGYRWSGTFTHIGGGGTGNPGGGSNYGSD